MRDHRVQDGIVVDLGVGEAELCRIVFSPIQLINRTMPRAPEPPATVHVSQGRKRRWERIVPATRQCLKPGAGCSMCAVSTKLTAG